MGKTNVSLGIINEMISLLKEGKAKMTSQNLLSYWKVFISIMIGTAIYAFGLHYFVISNKLMEGGVTGISLLFNYALGLPLSLTNLLLNIPLFIVGWKVLGKQFMVFTIWGTLFLSFFLWIMEQLIKYKWIVPFTTNDYLLAALYAGATLGSGLGLIFRYGASTGGTDIIAQLGKHWRGWQVGQMILIIDALVLMLSFLYIPREKVLYSLISIFIASKMIHYITEGVYSSKAFTIITNQSHLLAAAIQLNIRRGVTIIPTIGGYKQQNNTIIYCVVSRHEVRRLKLLVHQVDSNAFMVINDVKDVLGQGFNNQKV